MLYLGLEDLRCGILFALRRQQVAFVDRSQTGSEHTGSSHTSRAPPAAGPGRDRPASLGKIINMHSNNYIIIRMLK